MSGPLDHRGDRTGRSHEPLARRERQVTAQNHEARVKDTVPRPDVGYPRFPRNPFARDVLLDPGGTAVPRITALHMLRSTIRTVSAPANSSFRGSITHPTQPLCTLRVRRRRRLTQHSLPGDLLGLTWAGLAPADRASFAGAFSHSITSSARASSIGGTSRPSERAVCKLMTNSNLVDCKTGSSAGLAPLRMLPV